MEIKLTSTAFAQGERIPKEYTGQGQDSSPPLVWSDLPEGTKELALICDDPDAPTAEPWVHWVIYKIPADVQGLPAGVPKDSRLKQPPGVLQGKNSWSSGQVVVYRGPMPPPGAEHRYFFTLYALNVRLVAEPGLTKAALLQDMGDHVIGRGQLMGTYER
jgi:Raf kinase inhibitor-like YbhB/YbcL family protein